MKIIHNNYLSVNLVWLGSVLKNIIKIYGFESIFQFNLSKTYSNLWYKLYIKENLLINYLTSISTWTLKAD